MIDLEAIEVLSREVIRAAMRNGADTLDIARVLQVREADVWNALARSDGAPIRGYVVMRQAQRESV